MTNYTGRDMADLRLQFGGKCQRRKLHAREAATVRVNPIGPIPCRGMIIGEGPGWEEDETGVPFVGKSGLLLDNALFRNSYQRDHFYITNVVKNRLTNAAGEDRTPTEAEIIAAVPELRAEIEEVCPWVILAVGASALNAVLKVCEYRTDLHGDVWLSAHHGKPKMMWNRWVVPCYHPAAGLHQPQFSPHFAHDVEQFAEILRLTDIGYGDFEPKPIPNKVGRLQGPVYLGGKFALDSEWTLKGTFTYSISGVRGEGYVVRPRELMFRDNSEVIFHYFPADVPRLEADGYPIHRLRWHDTMLKAYLLCVEPQALKDLVARHLNRARPEYSDIIRPYHEAKMWEIVTSTHEIYLQADEQRKEAAKELKKLAKKKDSPEAWAALVDHTKDLAEADEAREATKWAHSAARDQSAGKTVNLENRFKANQISIPHTDLFDVPEEVWLPYAADDAADTLLVSDVLDRELEKLDLTACYEMDRAVLPMLYEMQKTGLPVNIGKVLMLKDEFDIEIAQHHATMKKIAQEWNFEGDFNPRSTDDLVELLYNRLGWGTRRKTKGGAASTDDRALSLLADQIKLEQERFPFRCGSRHTTALALISAIQDSRELSVYSGTHCQGLLDFIRPDGQWFGYHWKYTRTTSGRFSTEDGNPLNIPVRTEKGKKVRDCIEAPLDWDGTEWSIASADLSQIELRVCAHLSQDKAMMEAFLNDRDLHSVTASLIFGIPLDRVKDHPAKRYAAKTINFAILYGISALALFEQLKLAGITEFDLPACEGLIREWFKAYSGVRTYFDGVLAATRRDGFVRDMWGRIRYLPNVYLPIDDWRGRQLRAEAERHACNHVIQAGATGIIKRAMSRLWSDVLVTMLRAGDRGFLRPILQIHDELLFLVQKGTEDIAEGLVRAAMTADEAILTVPLKSDWSTAATWGGIK